MIEPLKQIEYWKKGANEDIEVAKILITEGKYIHGLFFSHLAVEKILKALVVKTTEEIPPKSHNLLYLVEKAGVSVSEDERMFLAILIQYQLEG